MPKELMINETIYRFVQKYLQEEKLWECSFVDAKGNIAETDAGYLAAYDEVESTALSSLEEHIKDQNLDHNINNRIVLWKNLSDETRKRMKYWARSKKSELMGEWYDPNSRFLYWQKLMYERTGVVFTRSQYDNI